MCISFGGEYTKEQRMILSVRETRSKVKQLNHDTNKSHFPSRGTQSKQTHEVYSLSEWLVTCPP